SSRYTSTAQVAAMVRQATDRIEALPGVQFSASTVSLPMGQAQIDFPFSIEGRTPKDGGKWEGDEQWRFVSPHYFEALGIPLLRGRFFDWGGTAAADPVVLIDENLARQDWSQKEPLGRRDCIRTC